MPEFIKPFAEWCAVLIETLGIGIITSIAIVGLIHALIRLLKKDERGAIFQELRQRVGGGILLGLEFLIAADIIYTVVVEFTFKSIGVLAIIVLIRTFLSFTLEVELTGRWPWQNKSEG